MSKFSDRELGMDRSITRRDFLNGVGIAIGGSLIHPTWLGLGWPQEGHAPEQDPAYYPPALTGMRGSHEGSYEVAHGLREGNPWDTRAEETGEMYDLIVVGAGLSGLSAAYFFRKAAGPDAKILILDNHDDFGGHAKRNEFRYGDRLLIGYGGTESIDTPSSYTPEGKALLREIGVDLDRFYTAFDRTLYSSYGLRRGIFFDEETFGEDRLVVDRGDRSWSELAAAMPLPEPARRDLVRLHEEEVDYLPGLTPEEKERRLRSMSYRSYLLDVVRVHPLVAEFFQSRSHDRSAKGADAISAWSAFSSGRPGFAGMGLVRPLPPWLEELGLDAASRPDEEPYIFHFPDGNAGVARLIIRALIPEALPGTTMDDSVTAPVDYARLDEAASPVRVRLNSTVVRVRHRGDPAAAQEVAVTYVRGGKAFRVRAGSCILACYNAIIPYLCPELPERQKEALSMAVKAPLVYTNVLLRDWTSFERLGIRSIHSPAGFYSLMFLDFPVSLGTYRHSRTPEEPILLHMVRVPLRPGLPARDQFRAGRAELLRMGFEEFERRTRDQLARALGEGGFDPARDIAGITVNRWPHGYAQGRNELFDPDWPADERPWIVGRQRFGRISIANSDAAATALTQAAIDQGHRAVQEVLQEVLRRS